MEKRRPERRDYRPERTKASSYTGAGNTPAPDWTLDTLFTFFDQLIHDMGRRLDERYEAQGMAIDAAFSSQQTAMRTAFEASEKAVDRALAAAESAVDKRQDTLDKEFHEHLLAVREENKLAFTNSNNTFQEAQRSAKEALGKAEVATDKRFEAISEAVGKAEIATDKRFEAVNEFRAQLNDQAALFMPRTEAVSLSERNTDRLSTLQDRFNALENQGVGRVDAGNTRRLDNAQVIALVGLVVGILSVAAVVVAAIVHH